MVALMLGAFLLLCGLLLLGFALWLRAPNHLIAVTGTLTTCRHIQNASISNGRRVRVLTEYAYAYTVNGKRYLRKGIRTTHYRRIPKKLNFFYVKGFPFYSLPEKYSDIWLFWASLSTLFLVCGAILVRYYSF